MPPHPRDTWPKPPTHRLVLAFAGAPSSATALFAIVASIGQGGPDLVWSVFIVDFLGGALPLTPVVGIPLFLILRKRVRLTFWASSLAGVAVLYLLLSVFLLFSLASKDAPGGGLGWLEIVEILGDAAGLGLVAGFVFWLIAAAGLKGKQDLA